MLTRAAEAESEGLPSLRPDQHALMGASMLAFDCVDSLTHDQLLALLRYLADLALDSERMRGILQREHSALPAHCPADDSPCSCLLPGPLGELAPNARWLDPARRAAQRQPVKR